MSFTIEFLDVADHDLQGFPQQDQRTIIKKIKEQLIVSPFPHGITIKRLQGFSITIYRLRINAPDQSYGVFYQITC